MSDTEKNKNEPDWLGVLQNPAAVFNHMLRGTIAKPSDATIKSLYPHLFKDLVEVRVREALERCHQSFRNREHGGVAEGRLREELERILETPYQQFLNE